MRIAEYISVFTLLTGLLFKLQHYPGAGVLLILSMLSLIIIYLVEGLRSDGEAKSREESLDDVFIKEVEVKKRLVSNFPIALYFAVSLFAILFKLQKYPGTNGMYIISFITLLYALVYSYFKNPRTFISSILKNGFRLIIMLITIPTYIKMALRY